MSSNFLSGWKQIAAYTGFTERTLQRWEHKFSFPVHRPAGKARSAVSALSSEIDAWLSDAPGLPEIQQTLARYPGKSPRQTIQLQGSGRLIAYDAADQIPQRPNMDQAGIFLSGLSLMEQLTNQQAEIRREVVHLRAEVGKTRELSAQMRRNLKPIHSPFIR